VSRCSVDGDVSMVRGDCEMRWVMRISTVSIMCIGSLQRLCVASRQRQKERGGAAYEPLGRAALTIAQSLADREHHSRPLTITDVAHD
jgi:hypothetical protein